MITLNPLKQFVSSILPEFNYKVSYVLSVTEKRLRVSFPINKERTHPASCSMQHFPDVILVDIYSELAYFTDRMWLPEFTAIQLLCRQMASKRFARKLRLDK